MNRARTVLRRGASSSSRRNNRGLFRAMTLSSGKKWKSEKREDGSTTPEPRRNEKPYFYIRRNELLYTRD